MPTECSSCSDTLPCDFHGNGGSDATEDHRDITRLCRDVEDCTYPGEDILPLVKLAFAKDPEVTVEKLIEMVRESRDAEEHAGYACDDDEQAAADAHEEAENDRANNSTDGEVR